MSTQIEPHRVFLAVIHYSPLKDRRKFLEERLPRDLDANWITEESIIEEPNVKLSFNSLSLGIPLIDVASGFRHNSFTQMYSRRTSSWIIHILRFCSKFMKRAESSLLGALPPQVKSHTKFQELKLMHFTALHEGVLAGKEWIVVLEDDAVPTERFRDSLNFLQTLNTEDAYWINFNDGKGPNLFKTKSDPKSDALGFFKLSIGSTRCGVAYAVNMEYANQILDRLKTFGVPDWIPIDLIYDAILKDSDAACYWQEPASVLQGSSNGFYQSNYQKLRSNES